MLSRRAVWPVLQTLLRRGLASSALQDELKSLARQLSLALEHTQYVQESAAQLMLETDPSNRQPRGSYEDRYRLLALGQVTAALESYDKLKAAAGEAAVDGWLRQEGLAVAVADAQLARDNLGAELRASQRRQEANEVLCRDDD